MKAPEQMPKGELPLPSPRSPDDLDQRILAYARDKMTRKKLDMIVANDVSDQSIGFNSDQNAATVIWHTGEQTLEPMGKDTMARHIVDIIAGQAGTET